MLWVLFHQIRSLWQFKIFEFETGGDGTTDQRKGAGIVDGRPEQGTGWNNVRQGFPVADIAAKNFLGGIPLHVNHVNRHRGTIVEMPQFVLLKSV